MGLDINEVPDHLQSEPRIHNDFGKTHAIKEIINSPQILLILICSIFALIGGAIRLTRISISSAVESFHTYVESEDNHNIRSIRSIFTVEGFFGSVKTFWRLLPRRLWNFYIDAFIVPFYRKEWGKYNVWNCRSRKRLPQPYLIKAELRRLKKKKKADLEATKEAPKPTPHDHSCCSRVTINVSGMLYETQLRTLERYPETLLGSAMKRIQYYDPTTQQYYFDRNRLAFEAILHYYQSGGRLRRLDNVPSDVLLEDALFFELSQAVVEKYRLDEGLVQSMNRTDIVPRGLLRRKIWLLFDFPESSIQAEIVGVFSIIALFLSVGAFCIDTLRDLEPIPVISVKPDGKIHVEFYDPFNIHDPFFFTETVCVSWFVVELVARFVCCPIMSKFIKRPLNIIDAFALLPYFISFFPYLSEVDSATVNATDTLYILRIIRIVRVFRIFKLSRHSKGLKILGKTLEASMNEMLLLIFFIVLGVIFFSSTMYFAELEAPHSKFKSVVGGFWWALITITTVGFGDIVPVTVGGKIVGTFCAIAGVLTIALPVPVIVANFNYFYQQAIEETDFQWININHVGACPYRPQGFQRVENFYMKKAHHTSLSEHNTILQRQYTEKDLQNLDMKKRNSQYHLGESIRSFATTYKQPNQDFEFSSDEEFGHLKRGKEW